VEAEAAAAAAQALIEEVEAQAQKEERKRKQKQKKKQKEKEKRVQAKGQDGIVSDSEEEVKEKEDVKEKEVRNVPNGTSSSISKNAAKDKKDSRAPKSNSGGAVSHDDDGGSEEETLPQQQTPQMKKQQPQKSKEPHHTASSNTTASVKEKESPQKVERQRPHAQEAEENGSHQSLSKRAAQSLESNQSAPQKRDSSPESGGFEENHRSRVRRRGARGQQQQAQSQNQGQGQASGGYGAAGSGSAHVNNVGNQGGGKGASRGEAASSSATSGLKAQLKGQPPAAAAPSGGANSSHIADSVVEHPQSSPSKATKAPSQAVTSTPSVASAMGSTACSSAGRGSAVPGAPHGAPNSGERMGNVPKAAPKAAAPKKAGAAPSRPTADAGAQPPPQQQQPPPQQQQRASPPVVGSSSACSSASRGTANQVEKDKLVPVYPEQVVTQQDGQLGEYAQFVCKICGLVVRAPAMLSCAHMFCQRCFSQWVQETKPDVRCPTCSQAMKPQDVVYFDGKGAQSAAYGLVYRLYSGMKVRCCYHKDLLAGTPRSPAAEKAKAMGLSCTWRGALHDYTPHLANCEVHQRVAEPAISSTAPPPAPSAQVVSASAAAKQPVCALANGNPAAPQSCSGASTGLQATRGAGNRGIGAEVNHVNAGNQSASQTQAATSQSSSSPRQTWYGAYQVTSTCRLSEEVLQLGTELWVSNTDDSQGWAWAQLMRANSASVSGWVPLASLQRSVYCVVQPFQVQQQDASRGLSLNRGDMIHVYYRQASGWSYGARLERQAVPHNSGQSQLVTMEEGWFPEVCVADPLPVVPM